MTAYTIKLLAIITMVIDHIGLFFFPHLIFLRIIGRLSFPLFAWLIANGAYYTHDIKAYLTRILIFALISQIPFAIANHLLSPSLWYLNVLFTLFLGLLATSIIKRNPNKLVWLITTILCSFVAFFLNTEYGIVGVLSIISFYLFFNNIKYLVLSQIVIFISPYILLIWLTYYYHLQLPSVINAYIEPLGLLSLILIFLYARRI